MSGPDLVMRGLEVSFGIGFAIPPSPILRLELPTPNALFWGGSGGSFVLIDLDAHATFAYAMNRMNPTTVGDERSFRIIRAVWEALGKRG